MQLEACSAPSLPTQAPWPFAIDAEFECSLARLALVEIEATNTFEMAKGCVNEDELIGLCKATVTKKMVDVE